MGETAPETSGIEPAVEEAKVAGMYLGPQVIPVTEQRGAAVRRG